MGMCGGVYDRTDEFGAGLLARGITASAWRFKQHNSDEARPVIAPTPASTSMSTCMHRSTPSQCIHARTRSLAQPAAAIN